MHTVSILERSGKIMDLFNFLVVGIHGFHSIFFFHLIFREQPILGFGLILAIVLYMIYRKMNR